MKIKRTIAGLIAMPLLLLTSCTDQKYRPSGAKIDCYRIRFDSYSCSYSEQTYPVYEYTSVSGLHVYCSFEQASVEIYEDRHKTNKSPVEYSYSQTIGFVTLELHYYYYPESRIVDAAQEIHEYKGSATAEEGHPEKKLDHRLAFNCAQGTYICNTTYPEYNVIDSTIYLDLLVRGLEFHTFTQLGDNTVVTYAEKWF